MDYELTANLTLLFLILFFLSSAIYQSRKKISGIIEGFVESPFPMGGIGGAEVKVRLPNDELIIAHASPCAICLGHLRLGESVGLLKTGNGYLIKPSLFFRARKVTYPFQNKKGICGSCKDLRETIGR